MKKFFILVAFVMSFIGCEKVSPLDSDVTIKSGIEPNFYYINNGYIIFDFHYICDRKTNNLYIYYSVGHRAVLSPYYNAESKIAKCNEVK